MKIKQATKQGFAIVRPGGVFDYTFPSSKTRRGRVIDNGKVSPTLETTSTVAKLESEEKEMKVRRLTPRECFRLQGWSDEYFDRAAFVNSDTQLYKQAGNGVTVNVIYEIARRMK